MDHLVPTALTYIAFGCHCHLFGYLLMHKTEHCASSTRTTRPKAKAKPKARSKIGAKVYLPGGSDGKEVKLLFRRSCLEAFHGNDGVFVGLGSLALLISTCALLTFAE